MNLLIACIAARIVPELFSGLVDLLRDAVDSGASLGFLPSLTSGEALQYWQGIAADVQAGTRVLLVARHATEGGVLGAVQLDLATKPNARHRAEVAKLLVHRKARRQGLGRQLLLAAEAHARPLGRTTLVLDTRHGDVSELLCQSLQYQLVGLIPEYFVDTDGQLHATAVYYKLLGNE